LGFDFLACYAGRRLWVFAPDCSRGIPVVGSGCFVFGRFYFKKNKKINQDAGIHQRMAKIDILFNFISNKHIKNPKRSIVEMNRLMAPAAKSKESKLNNAPREKAQPSLRLIVDQDSDQSKLRRRKTAPGRKRGNRLAMMVFLSVALAVFGPLIMNVHQYFKLKLELKEAQDTYAELSEIKNQLTDELNYLDTPEAIERLARENLGMIMPGETLVNQAIAQDDIPRLGKTNLKEISH
jgi:cell division protein FtsL